MASKEVDFEYLAILILNAIIFYFLLSSKKSKLEDYILIILFVGTIIRSLSLKDNVVKKVYASFSDHRWVLSFLFITILSIYTFIDKDGVDKKEKEKRRNATEKAVVRILNSICCVFRCNYFTLFLGLDSSISYAYRVN